MSSAEGQRIANAMRDSQPETFLVLRGAGPTFSAADQKIVRSFTLFQELIREIPNRVLRWVIAFLKYGVSGVGMSFIGPEKEEGA